MVEKYYYKDMTQFLAYTYKYIIIILMSLCENVIFYGLLLMKCYRAKPKMNASA